MSSEIISLDRAGQLPLQANCLLCTASIEAICALIRKERSRPL